MSIEIKTKTFQFPPGGPLHPVTIGRCPCGSPATLTIRRLISATETTEPKAICDSCLTLELGLARQEAAGKVWREH